MQSYVFGLEMDDLQSFMTMWDMWRIIMNISMSYLGTRKNGDRVGLPCENVTPQNPYTYFIYTLYRVICMETIGGSKRILLVGHVLQSIHKQDIVVRKGCQNVG